LTLGRVNAAVQPRHRIIFVDLARTLAVVLMVAGHTSSALLASEFRSGPWFEAWTFQRGLTSALFLLLSGFAFSLATTRHWVTHLRLSLPVFKRVRRFLLFVVLGYGLHLPVLPASALATASDAEWRSFLAVDVLQLIGVTLLALQALVWLLRSRRVFMVVNFAIAVAIVAAAPAVWRGAWAGLPLPLAAYLSPAAGSLFPLFPWAAYVFLGAGAGQVYAQWGAAHLARYALWAMLVPGLALTMAGSTFGAGTITSDVAIRTGACLLILAAIAHASGYLTQLPHVFGAVAQESLVVYFVHLCLVYGSIWNPGLAHLYGEGLGLPATALVAVAVVGAMVGLAWQWNWLKHVRPVAARRVAAAAGIVLVARLI
jgi:acyltransferase